MRRFRSSTLVIIILMAAALHLPALFARAVTLEWTRQLGSSSWDESYGVSADRLGNVYIGGYFGENEDQDAFLAKYDTAGNLQWTRRFGSSSTDEATGVSADGLGNVYISGFTRGSLAGAHLGWSDAFLAKYDTTGNRLWMRQFGTSDVDFARGVSADGLGNVYISGATYDDLGGPNLGSYDAFLAKYDGDGNRLWVQQVGTAEEDQSSAVSADRLGNVYISGYTWYGSLVGTPAGGADAFVAKYDAAGSLQWARQIATADSDHSFGVSTDGLGNVYVSGSTRGNLAAPNPGFPHGFLVKYDAAGNHEWTRQIETYGTSYRVSADGLGHVYVSGATYWSLAGPNAGSLDAFVAKYDATGNRVWTRQLGTSGGDQSHGVSADGRGNVYISGQTNGSLGGPNAGSSDAFLAKYSDAPILSGDFDADGSVNAADYVIWRKGFAGGTYTQADYDTWRANFGATAAGTVGSAHSSTNASVPEPSVLALIPFAVALIATRVRVDSKKAQSKIVFTGAT